MHFKLRAWAILILAVAALGACRRQDSVPVTPVEPFASVPPPMQPEPSPEPAASADATPIAAPEPPPKDPVESMTVPSDPIARARLYFESGYGAAAFQVISSLPEEERKKPEIQLLAGLSAEMCGRFREAATACAAAEALPDLQGRIESLLCQGRVWMQLKDFKSAMQKFQAAHAAAPKDPSTGPALMDALVTLDDGPGLLRTARRILEDEPSNFVAQFYLGMALAMTGQRDLADEAFGKLTERDDVPPYLEAAAFDQRGLLWSKAAPERARTLLEQCRKRVPAYGCPRTELAISPPDPRHPNRKIRNVTRPGRYGTAPLPPPP